MKKYYFDKDARIRYWCEAENDDDASKFFCDQIFKAIEAGLKIDVDTYQPSDRDDGISDNG